MASFLDRYQRGECQQVWAELFALGAKIRSQPLYRDALAVARETMRRVCVNIEMLLPRLEQLGYQFGYEWMNEWPERDEDWIASQPARYTSPPPDITSRLEQFETATGPLPLSIRAFYLEVGSVNFVGTHPEWEALASEYNPFHQAPEGLDPLFVWGLDEDTLACYRDWQETCAEEGDARPFHLPIAPDYDLKYNTSGCCFYEIKLTNAAIVACFSTIGIKRHLWIICGIVFTTGVCLVWSE